VWNSSGRHYGTRPEATDLDRGALDYVEVSLDTSDVNAIVVHTTEKNINVRRISSSTGTLEQPNGSDGLPQGRHWDV
jgi:hypothetical protein